MYSFNPIAYLIEYLSFSCSTPALSCTARQSHYKQVCISYIWSLMLSHIVITFLRYFSWSILFISSKTWYRETNTYELKGNSPRTQRTSYNKFRTLRAVFHTNDIIIHCTRTLDSVLILQFCMNGSFNNNVINYDREHICVFLSALFPWINIQPPHLLSSIVVDTFSDWVLNVFFNNGNGWSCCLLYNPCEYYLHNPNVYFIQPCEYS